MGSELSCPCGNRLSIDNEEETKESSDIIEEVMKGKLLPQQVTYEYIYDQSKVCLINTDDLEGFFANRNLLKLSTKKEINFYYNLVFITNFMSMNNQIFLLLQYTPGMEDKSFRDISYYNTSSKKSSKKNLANIDFSASYKVEKINLVSNDIKKVVDQIANDLNSNVKKDYLFYGIVSDSEETPADNSMNLNSSHISSGNVLSYMTRPHSSMSNHTPKSLRSFKILYKRSFLIDNIDCKYTVCRFEGQINPEVVYHIVNEDNNKFKILKAIMIDQSESGNATYSTAPEKKNYYFIFEENLSSEKKEYDYLVMEMEQGNNTNKIFLQDIAMKLNDFQHPYKLSCIVSDEKRFYLILYADLQDLANETPF